jgi:hypothetical protein
MPEIRPISARVWGRNFPISLRVLSWKIIKAGIISFLPSSCRKARSFSQSSASTGRSALFDFPRAGVTIAAGFGQFFAEITEKQLSPAAGGFTKAEHGFHLALLDQLESIIPFGKLQ